METVENKAALATELRLGLPGKSPAEKIPASGGKRRFKETNNNDESEVEYLKLKVSSSDPLKPPSKSQVVGWPPVRSFRKNLLSYKIEKSNNAKNDVALVKVSVDGAPYLRKVDLKMHKSYQDLSDALGKMFGFFTSGNDEEKGMIDFMKKRKSMDVINGSDFTPTYEDKDGDWMLLGDVPWEMFAVSCKRIRIMK